jgi:hypothetical protein
LGALNFTSKGSDFVVLSFDDTVESFDFLRKQCNLGFVLRNFLRGITTEFLELSLEFFVLIACNLELVVELSDLGGRKPEIFLSVSDLVSKLVVLIQEFLDLLSVSFGLGIIFSQPFLVLIKLIEKFLLLLG